MTTQRFGKPYVWVTWITGLLSGDDSCTYAAWFKAHYRFDKVERANGNLAVWKSEHAALVAGRKAALETAGYICTVEDQNKFSLVGETAILAGKPDIAGVSADGVLVSDGKTGKRRGSDVWQVFIYMVALPKIWKHWAGFRWTGEVVYRDAPVVIASEQVNGDVAAKIFTLMRVLGSDTPPAKVPSARECAFCDIPKSDCPERVEAEAEQVLVSEF